MDSHKRILGIINIVSGVLLLFGMMVVSLLFAFFIPLIAENSGDAQWHFNWLVPFFRAIAIFVIILMALPSLIAGWGLLNNKSWALTLALIIGCLQLFAFPIGTFIGIYTIWVYVEDGRKSKEPQNPL